MIDLKRFETVLAAVLVVAEKGEVDNEYERGSPTQAFAMIKDPSHKAWPQEIQDARALLAELRASAR